MAAPLKWEFPGGKIEPRESPAAALVRELREELGITVEVGAKLGEGESQIGGKTIHLDVYLAEIVSGEPRPTEHAAVAWLDADEVQSIDWAEADIPVVSRLGEHLRAARGERTT